MNINWKYQLHQLQSKPLKPILYFKLVTDIKTQTSPKKSFQPKTYWLKVRLSIDHSRTQTHHPHMHTMHFLAYPLEEFRPFRRLPRHWPHLPRDSPFQIPSLVCVGMSLTCVVRRHVMYLHAFYFGDCAFGFSMNLGL